MLNSPHQNLYSKLAVVYNTYMYFKPTFEYLFNIKILIKNLKYFMIE